jgi:hypothetical protein
MFSSPDSFSAVPTASGPVFLFYEPVLIFGGTEGVGSRFNVLLARTRFRLYRGRRVSFSCFALPDSFSAQPRASAPVFMFCAPRLAFGGTEGVGSCTCFAHLNSFSPVPTTSAPVFMFCAPGLVFDGTEGVGSRFHVLRSRTRFRRYRGRRVPFSCFALPDSFSRVPRASGLIFMFCAPGLAFGCTVGVGSGFHVLRARTRFGRYRRRQVPFSYLRSAARLRRCGGRRVPFSCFRPRTRFRRFRGHRVPFSFFTSLYSFSAVPRASGPVFMFCARVLVFGCTEGVGTRFHILRSRTHFRRNRGRRLPFSCFALPDSLSAVPRASALVHVLRT